MKYKWMPALAAITLLISVLLIMSFSCVSTAGPVPETANLALNKPVITSSNENEELSGPNAVDGDIKTRWSSEFNDPQSIIVDLQGTYTIKQVVLRWETACGKDYSIQVSMNGDNWQTVKEVKEGWKTDYAVSFPPVGARYVKLEGMERATNWGYSLYEMEIYQTDIEPETTPRLSIKPTPKPEYSDINYSIKKTREVILTSEKGDKLAKKENIAFKEGQASGTVVLVRPDITKQTIDGIGSSFTESAAFVLAHLSKAKRKSVMEALYGKKGAAYTLTRTHIGACDFSVKGKYSYDDVEDDAALEHFSLQPDREGFSKSEYPGIKDESYDLLPMIKDALAINKDIKIIASPWTAPKWMKKPNKWYQVGQTGGGILLPEHYDTYARYLSKYIAACKSEGINIWGITPVNEPMGNYGQWESMHLSEQVETNLVKKYIGPQFEKDGFKDVRIIIYDQNRESLENWASSILSDEECAKYVYGSAVHWYADTVKVFEKELEKTHQLFPDKTIINTEACIDNLGCPAPGGCSDPEGFTETDFFKNDGFWWNNKASDWGYAVSWARKADHPLYAAVHRYARDIIEGLNFWMTGWIDWNAVLDKNGGPNHVKNYCGAPVMIDTETEDIYYTPVYYVLAQFSRLIRPGDKVLQVNVFKEGLDKDAIHACAVMSDKGEVKVALLNTTKDPIDFKLQIGTQYADINIEANAVQTILVPITR
ncbi:MAG: discoidin domain-containing protein [Spirochaetales bacterium]|nr:discoidin domain-containing protein [Spirochaetales bacterium]